MPDRQVLQTVRGRFNQYSVDPTCLLCGENPEDREHFLLRCHSLSESCDPFIKTIENVYHSILEMTSNDSELLVALILDCTC